MAEDQLFCVQGEDGVFRKLNDEYSITIYFDDEESMNNFISLLEKLNDLKMELPGQQEDKHEG